MKKIIASALLSLSSLTMVSVMVYEDQLHISPRYHAGTLQADVEYVQGKDSVNRQIVGATPYQTAILMSAFTLKVGHNMESLRKHTVCVDTPEKCKPVSPR